MSFFRKAFSVPNRHNKTAFQWIPFPLELRLVPNRLSKDGRRHIAPLYFDSLRSIFTDQKSVAAAISSYDASSSSCDCRNSL